MIAEEVERINSLLRGNNFIEINCVVEEAYDQVKMANKVEYLCDRLLSPFYILLNDVFENPDTFASVNSVFLEFLSQCPNSPLAAALSGHIHVFVGFGLQERAKFDTSHGYFDACDLHLEAARSVFEEYDAEFVDHWYWRVFKLDYTIFGNNNSYDVFSSFLRCVETQPKCGRLYEDVAHYFMNSDESSLSYLEKNADRALTEKDEDVCTWLYIAFFTYMIENSTLGHRLDLLVREKPLNAAANWYASHTEPEYLTAAACLFYWARNWSRFIDVTNNTNQLILENWTHPDEFNDALSNAQRLVR